MTQRPTILNSSGEKKGARRARSQRARAGTAPVSLRRGLQGSPDSGPVGTGSLPNPTGPRRCLALHATENQVLPVWAPLCPLLPSVAPPTLPPWPPLSFLLCPPVPASPTAPRGQTLRGQREMARSGVPGGKERSPPWTGQRPRQLTDTPALLTPPRLSPCVPPTPAPAPVHVERTRPNGSPLCPPHPLPPHCVP